MGKRKAARGGKAPVLIVIVVAAVMIASAAFLFLGQPWKTGPESSSPSITEIQKLGELVVLRVKVADVLEDSTEDYKGLWIVKGDALVAVDMRLAEQKVDENAKKLVVVLPQPRVIQPRVDHQKTKTYDVSKKIWFNPLVGDRNEFVDNALAKAQGIVESESGGDEVMDQARAQTELMLTNMYGFVGWDVDIVWQGGL